MAKKQDKTEKLKSGSVKSTKRTKSKYVKKGGNGGARKNAGRRKSIDKIEVQQVRQLLEEHGITEVSVKLPSGKLVTKARTLLIFDKLFDQAMMGDVTAGKEYLNRLLGKAQQPILLSGQLTSEHKLSKETLEEIDKTWELFKSASKKYANE